MDRHTTDNAWQSLFAVFWRGDVSEDLGREVGAPGVHRPSTRGLSSVLMHMPVAYTV